MIRIEADVFTPDGDEARRWAEEELSNPRYADAKPTWFDYVARDVAEFFLGLFDPRAGEAAGGVALIVVSVVVVAALVTVLILWGRPRMSERVKRDRRVLLGERDDRSATQLRADAERSARGGDWDAAIVLRFRALARGLLERDLIDPAPGATAQAIAREAGGVFAGEGDALTAVAGTFDDVRYLRHPASEDDYRRLAATDDRLSALQPSLTAAPALPSAVPV